MPPDVIESVETGIEGIEQQEVAIEETADRLVSWFIEREEGRLPNAHRLLALAVASHIHRS